jgi:hypothetical protein
LKLAKEAQTAKGQAEAEVKNFKPSEAHKFINKSAHTSNLDSEAVIERNSHELKPAIAEIRN